MSWFRQYLTAFRNDGVPSDGLFEKADGTVWLRNPDGSETQVGSGGSQPGVPVVKSFAFAYNTPDILTGLDFYTPVVGEILLDAWVSVLTGWGVKGSAIIDIGTDWTGGKGMFAAGDVGAGISANATDSNYNFGAGDILKGSFSGNVNWPLSEMNVLFDSMTPATVAARFVPAKFTTTSPLQVVANDTGAPGGSDTGATDGSAVVYLVTVIPVAL